jgi:hypothetical protein
VLGGGRKASLQKLRGERVGEVAFWQRGIEFCEGDSISVGRKMGETAS